MPEGTSRGGSVEGVVAEKVSQLIAGLGQTFCSSKPHRTNEKDRLCALATARQLLVRGIGGCGTEN